MSLRRSLKVKAKVDSANSVYPLWQDRISTRHFVTLCDSESVCNLNWSPRTKTHLYRNFAHLLDLFSVSKTTRELLLKWSNEPVRLSSEVSPQKVENPLENYQTSFYKIVYKLILNYNWLYLSVCVCMSFQKLNTTHKTNTINRQLMMICVRFQFQVKMPQFLVEDVIAETCDETAIMGERNFWKHFEPKWSESSKWSRWQIASSWIIRLKCQQDVNISNSKLPFIVEIVFSHSSKHGHFMGDLLI